MRFAIVNLRRQLNPCNERQSDLSYTIEIKHFLEFGSLSELIVMSDA